MRAPQRKVAASFFLACVLLVAVAANTLQRSPKPQLHHTDDVSSADHTILDLSQKTRIWHERHENLLLKHTDSKGNRSINRDEGTPAEPGTPPPAEPAPAPSPPPAEPAPAPSPPPTEPGTPPPTEPGTPPSEPTKPDNNPNPATTLLHRLWW